MPQSLFISVNICLLLILTKWVCHHRCFFIGDATHKYFSVASTMYCKVFVIIIYFFNQNSFHRKSSIAFIASHSPDSNDILSHNFTVLLSTLNLLYLKLCWALSCIYPSHANPYAFKPET